MDRLRECNMTDILGGNYHTPTMMMCGVIVYVNYSFGIAYILEMFALLKLFDAIYGFILKTVFKM